MSLSQCFLIKIVILSVSSCYCYRILQKNPVSLSRAYYIKTTSLSLKSLISPTDQFSIYAAIATSATLGIKSEKTAIGRSLSGPVTAMLIGAILTNANILPFEGSIFISSLQTFVVKLATPLLLFGADIRKIITETGVLFKAFILGTIGTLLGSLISFLIFHKGFTTVGNYNDYWKIAGALTAKNIGGGLNFMAVAETLRISSISIAVGLAVDNIVGLMYFPFITWLCNNFTTTSEKVEATKKYSVSDIITISNPSDELESIMITLSIGLSITAFSEYLSKIFSIPVLPISTIISVLLATIGSKFMSKYVLSGELIGKLLLYLFFASIGISSGKITTLFSTVGGLSLFCYGLVMYIIHLLFIITTGKLLSIPMPDILVASNANIGNSATASALCTSLNWKSRLLPGILVGTFGNIIGTFVGLWFGTTILKFI